MTTAITNDVSVSVETFYEEKGSHPELMRHIFYYRITIQNHGEVTVQLMRRHWYITDSNWNKREVEGDGVVGQQPIIQPNEKYEYISACDLQSELGKMHGFYEMRRMSDGTEFEVEIPEFVMAVPYRLN